MPDSEEDSVGLSTISGIDVNMGKNVKQDDSTSPRFSMQNMLAESPEIK